MSYLFPGRSVTDDTGKDHSYGETRSMPNGRQLAILEMKTGIEAEAQSVELVVPWWKLGRRLFTDRCTSYDFRFPMIEAMISFKILTN